MVQAKQIPQNVLSLLG
ncbi:hypothetical protein [Halomonas qinghailakensis]